jgi:hypothetical protein
MPVILLVSALGLGGSFFLGYGGAKTTDKWVTYAVIIGAGFIAYTAVKGR